MKRFMFWLFIKVMFYKEQIAELFIDLATSGTILDVAFLLLKFSLIVWVKSGYNPLLNSASSCSKKPISFNVFAMLSAPSLILRRIVLSLRLRRKKSNVSL